MAKVDICINSVSKLMDVVKEWEPKYFNYQIGYPETWFRGQGSVNDPLRPGILRKKIFKNDKHIDFPRGKFDMERSLFVRFIHMTPELFPIGLSNVEKYFIAQHYGLPTRLLDWTTSPICALYFAVEENPDYEDLDGVLYGMNPKMLDWKGVHLQSHPNLEKHVNNLIADVDKCTPMNKYEKSRPIAYYPSWSSKRMHSQSARFVFFEPIPDQQNEKTDIDETIFDLKDDTPRKDLVRYIIPAHKKIKIRNELRLLGISRSTFFPDIDNIVRDIKEHYIYWTKFFDILTPDF